MPTSLESYVSSTNETVHFEISNEQNAFLLDGKPFTLRCGELHYARIPRPYWRQRLKMLRAMGCNAVGCYMFWNFHEREKGVFKWDGEANALIFCQMAQEEGLWVILRPGPYACAEWEGGGAPWWLMAHDTDNGAKPIAMRSSDPRWVTACTNWIHEVGRVLGPMQVTKGGPILMVQVENEYGLHGSDTDYIRALRQATLDAGFEVPLYACNPPRVIENGFVPELFQAANFGAQPKEKFDILRRYQPKGPLFCSEYYPAWFDTWGQAHHYAKDDREFFEPIDWMMDHDVSFSLYMADGGTSFGGWTGCRNPFVPNVTSYDYEAPISEQGTPNPSFQKFRDRCAKHLNEGESIPELPQLIPVKGYGELQMERLAPVDALIKRDVKIDSPVFMEHLDQGFGLVSYETIVPKDVGGVLRVGDIHDFGYVYLDGERIGTLDRRHQGYKIRIWTNHEKDRKLQILVEAMGRINSSTGMEDRKGLNGPVRLDRTELKGWTARMMPINPDFEFFDLGDWAKMEDMQPFQEAEDIPAIYRGTLYLRDQQPADTWIDMSRWTKGIVWINGHNMGRFWSIGPQQTLYVPGCWLRRGRNDIIVLDFFGPREGQRVTFLDHPILDQLNLETDFNRKTRMNENFLGGTEVAKGTFPPDDAAQVVMFEKPARGNFFTLEAKSTYDRKNLASLAEFQFLDEKGEPINAADVIVSGIDSEEEVREDGTAENAIDGQVEACWLTSSRTLPHWIEFFAPDKKTVYGFRYTPRQGKNVGRIRDWKFYVR